MKKVTYSLIIFTYLLSLLSYSISAAEMEKKRFSQQEPYALLNNIAGVTFERFNAELDIIKANPDHLKQIITEEMLPYVNDKYASFKVLGNKHYKQMTKAQKLAFVDAFKDYMITIYAQVFTNYRVTQMIEVEPVKAIKPDTKIVIVKSRIIEPGRPDIEIFFKLRRDSKTGDWSAFDMDAEGISMLNTKRKEIGAAINRHGIAAVVEDLKQKSQKPLVLKNG